MKNLLFIAISVLLMTITVIHTDSTEVTEFYSVTETTTVTQNTTTEIIETTTEPTRTMFVTTTAYCPCVECCGKSDGITASGVKAKANHTIAVDTRVIPFGTTVIINGNEYVAEDTGSAIKGNKIDIYFDSHEEALGYGKKILEIEVME
ncbi:MAG: 3D domain-containing protein [Clostridia bacterium]|nr:3D domain-containing protein [Clostridia bacterium]